MSEPTAAELRALYATALQQIATLTDERAAVIRDALKFRAERDEARAETMRAGGRTAEAQHERELIRVKLAQANYALSEARTALAQAVEQLTEAHEQIGVLHADNYNLSEQIATLTAENAALKAGIRADLGGGHSLPDFWTAEKQLPYVAQALTQARAERDEARAIVQQLSPDYSWDAPTRPA